MTFKRGDKVKAARDVALGLDVVIRAGCPGRVGQRIGALSHTYVVLFTSRDDIAENEIIVKDLTGLRPSPTSRVVCGSGVGGSGPAGSRP